MYFTINYPQRIVYCLSFNLLISACRKVHTESSKKWLDRLQVEKVPVLVCLTFADKLYAEHMKDGEHLTDESKYPDKIFIRHKLQAELAVSYKTARLHVGGLGSALFTQF